MNSDYFQLLCDSIDEFLAASSRSEEQLWELLITKTAPVLHAEAATYFEADDSKKTLSFKRSIGPVSEDLVNVSFPYQGVAGWCAQNRKPVCVNDTSADPRFTVKVDLSSGFKTKSVLAVPAYSGGKLLGVVEYVNSVPGAFSPEELRLAAATTAFVAGLAACLRLETALKQYTIKSESATIDNLSGGFIGADLDGKIIFFNPKAKEIFEVQEDFKEKNLISLFQLSPDIVAALGAVLKQGKIVRRKDFRYTVNGKTKVIGYSTINIKGVEGNVIGAGIIFQDITEI